MEYIEALETYFSDTRQIHPLARRQALVLSRSVADKSLEDEARVLLLINLLALSRGAPRSSRDFLLQPLKRETVMRHLEECAEEPGWKDVMLNERNLDYAGALLSRVMKDPRRFTPLTGTVPENDDTSCPLLVIGDSRMGFSQYWNAAMALELSLLHRLNNPGIPVPAGSDAAGIMRSIFDQGSILAGGRKYHERQAAAAALALRTPFLVISGGPGTGKTSVVIQILRALMRAFPEIEPRGIMLCAPTGRAKARLGESIDEGISRLEPGEGQGWSRDSGLSMLQRKTLHSLLSQRPDGTMKYHRGNPLPCQVIVVDEASMVDLSLFAALLEAAPSTSRIILAGDMHQLPSVAAGAVLGDLTERFNDIKNFATLSEDTGEWIRAVLHNVPLDKSEDDPVIHDSIETEKAGVLKDHVIILTRSYRSSEKILQVSSLVNRGRHEEAIEAIKMDGTGAVRIVTSGGDAPIREWIREYYGDEGLKKIAVLKGMNLENLNDPETRGLFDAAFALLDESRILTLVHEGNRGRKRINDLSAGMVMGKQGTENMNGFFHGEPVIMNRNHHDLDLYNGDTGMAVQSRDGVFRAVFRRGKNIS